MGGTLGSGPGPHLAGPLLWALGGVCGCLSDLDQAPNSCPLHHPDIRRASPRCHRASESRPEATSPTGWPVVAFDIVLWPWTKVRAAWGMFTVPPGSLEPFPPAAEAPEQGSPCRLPGSAGLPLRVCPARPSPSRSSKPLPHARVTQPYSKEWEACARGPPAMSIGGHELRGVL